MVSPFPKRRKWIDSSFLIAGGCTGEWKRCCDPSLHECVNERENVSHEIVCPDNATRHSIHQNPFIVSLCSLPPPTKMSAHITSDTTIDLKLVGMPLTVEVLEESRSLDTLRRTCRLDAYVLMRHYHEHRLRSTIALYEHETCPRNMEKIHCRDNQLKYITKIFNSRKKDYLLIEI